MSHWQRENPSVIKEHVITRHLSVGLMSDGSVMTIIDGEPFIQCVGAVFTAPNEESLSERFSNFKNMDEILAHRSGAEIDLDAEMQISRETEFLVHASNIEGWVMEGYNVDIIDSRIAFPILIKLSKVDENARNAFYWYIEQRFIEGNVDSKMALIMLLDTENIPVNLIIDSFMEIWENNDRNQNVRREYLLNHVSAEVLEMFKKKIGYQCNETKLTRANLGFLYENHFKAYLPCEIRDTMHSTVPTTGTLLATSLKKLRNDRWFGDVKIVPFNAGVTFTTFANNYTAAFIGEITDGMLHQYSVIRHHDETDRMHMACLHPDYKIFFGKLLSAIRGNHVDDDTILIFIPLLHDDAKFRDMRKLIVNTIRNRLGL